MRLVDFLCILSILATITLGTNRKNQRGRAMPRGIIRASMQEKIAFVKDNMQALNLLLCGYPYDCNRTKERDKIMASFVKKARAAFGYSWQTSTGHVFWLFRRAAEAVVGEN